MKFIMALLRDKKGFTLMELLVAIAIFGILSTFLVANFSRNEQARELKDQAERLVAGLQRAQNLAMTGAVVNDQLPLAYFIGLYNCSNNCFYDFFVKFLDRSPIERVYLDKISISIYRVIKAIPDPDPAPAALLTYFYLPRGDLYINNNYADGREKEKEYNEVLIELTHKDDSRLVYCLTINSISGRIDLAPGNCPS